MNIKAAFQFIITEFGKNNIRFALIGGYALENAGVVRATMDIDLLVLADDRPVLDGIMKVKGYCVLHESEDVINYVGDEGLGRIDVLLAHRKYTLAMLKRASATKVLNHDIHVVLPEDLIGLKVQAIANDPARMLKDGLDIQMILKENKDKLNMEQVKEYFELFEMEDQLENLLRNIS
jgi:predicted nucleotidyltransferase